MVAPFVIAGVACLVSMGSLFFAGTMINRASHGPGSFGNATILGGVHQSDNAWINIDASNSDILPLVATLVVAGIGLAMCYYGHTFT